MLPRIIHKAAGHITIHYYYFFTLSKERKWKKSKLDSKFKISTHAIIGQVQTLIAIFFKGI